MHSGLFLEGEENGKNDENEGYEMVPPETFRLKEDQREAHKHCDRDNFLNNFQFDQRKRPTVTHETDAVCGHLKAVFEKCYPPTEQDDKH